MIKSYLAATDIRGIFIGVGGLLERIMKDPPPLRSFLGAAGRFSCSITAGSPEQSSDLTNTKVKRFLIRSSGELWDKEIHQKSILQYIICYNI